MFTDNFNIQHVYGQNLLEQHDIKKINLIDIREPFELSICKIPGSLHIPMRSLLLGHKKLLDKDKTYYIICHTGQRSYYTCDELIKNGYNVINVIGGIASIDEYNVPY
jgi:rhodanese-related sulfurtransferase